MRLPLHLVLFSLSLFACTNKENTGDYDKSMSCNEDFVQDVIANDACDGMDISCTSSFPLDELDADSDGGLARIESHLCAPCPGIISARLASHLFSFL